TANNQLKFTALADNTLIPYAKVIGGNGAQLALNTAALGVKGVPSTTQATVYKTSLAEVTAPTDFVRLTKSEVINSAITVAGLEINGDGVAITGSGSLTITTGSLTVTGANPATATIAVPLTLSPSSGDDVVQID